MPAGRLRSRLPAAVVAALGLVGCEAAGDGASSRQSPAGDLRGTAFVRPVPRPTFTFPDTRGSAYDFASRTEGKLVFLFFGFTSCPDVCPVHMAGLAAALQELPVETRSTVEVVFVSVDPIRDTPERVREWLDSFSPSFVGLVPSLEQANGVLEEMLIGSATHVPRPEGEGYDVVHPASVMAFSPSGPARVRYGFGTRRADWSHDLPHLLEMD